jgi:N utilization substance protein B
MRARSRARSRALQALYAWEARGAANSPVDTMRQFLGERRLAPPSRQFVEGLIKAFAAHRQEVDQALGDALTNWRLERLSVIDRNILRIGATEMLYLEDIPARVSIQEAIRLAERYGTSESPRFVNGVLDALMHRIEDGPEGRRREP